MEAAGANTHHGTNETSPASPSLLTALLSNPDTIHGPHEFKLGRQEDIDHDCCTEDITVLAGRHRRRFHVKEETLTSRSTYFRNIVEHERKKEQVSGTEKQKLVLTIDCDEEVFQNILWLLRYNSFDSLPNLPGNARFRVHREMEILGIILAEEDKVVGHKGRRGAESRKQLPGKVTDPTRVEYVYRHGSEREGRCPCSSSHREHCLWVVSVLYGHIFCSLCGEPARMSQKLLAQLFLAAACDSNPQPSSFKAGWLIQGGITKDRIQQLENVDSCICFVCKGNKWGLLQEHHHVFCCFCLDVPKCPNQISKLFMSALELGTFERKSCGRRTRAVEELPTSSSC